MCTLRSYKASDYDAVINKVVSERFLRKYLNLPFKYRLLKLLKLYYSEFYLLESDKGKILAAGVIRAKLHILKLQYTYWFYGIEVEKENRGKGLGFLLILKMMNLLRSKGCRRVYLKVRKDNNIAIDLYRKLGFLTLAIHKKEYILINNL